MAVIIALLRGVNVGGNSRIKMADLKAAMESAGFHRVETYIQSGNALFESNVDEETLTAQLEQLIESGFGFRPPVVLRSAGELRLLVGSCPFAPGEVAAAKAANTEGESLYVSLQTRALTADAIAKLRQLEGDGDRFHVVGRDVVLLLRHSIRHSRLATQLDRLTPPGTVRNWNTLTKINELADMRDV